MKVKIFGQTAILEFQNNYDGKSEFEHRKQVDKDDLNGLFYSNKTTFSFEKYVSNMRQTFNVIENQNVPFYEEDKVRQILDNINFL